MNSYIVVARFKSEVTQDDVREMIPAEQAQAKVLEDQGLLGSIKIAMPKRTVFLEVFANDDSHANSTIESLPMSMLWDWEIFETTPPAGAPS